MNTTHSSEQGHRKRLMKLVMPVAASSQRPCAGFPSGSLNAHRLGPRKGPKMPRLLIVDTRCYFGKHVSVALTYDSPCFMAVITHCHCSAVRALGNLGHMRGL
jgi:hypothetical protein